MSDWNPQANEIFLRAIELATPDERRAYITAACEGDTRLRIQAEALLEAIEQAGSFLEAPAPSPTGTVGLPPLTEAVGTVIGPYKLMEQIGEGGMGVVYVAEQTKPVRRKVALKIIKPGMDTKQVIARFEAERQALAMMDHPNIARVFDGGATDSGRPYFVMELVRGVPITEYCDGERLSIRDRLELFVLVCRAVQHAHQKGIIHRDIKPSNVLITLHDGVPVPKIIDFGVAKATGQALTEKTLYTAFAQLIGTPLYMSPEQVELSGVDIDTRSDVYSLGVLLYELMTGTTPFDQETLRTAAFDEVRRIIREQEPPKPSTRLSSLGATRTTVSAKRKTDARQLDRTVRGELDWIVMKALEKDRRRRYETANDFASDVTRHLTDQPVEACPPSAWYRFRKFATRNRRSVTTAALLVVSGLIIGWVLLAVQLQRVSRVRQLSQDVRQALAGAKTAIEARNLTLANQRVAEAQGRLGTDGASVPDLAAEVEGVQRKIGAQQAEETRFQQLLTRTIEAIEQLMGGTVESQYRKAEEALELFGVLTDRDWLRRLDSSYLGSEQKRQVRETAYVTLVSLADNQVRWHDDPSMIQRSLDLLRRAEAFHSPTRAFYFVRSECHRRLKNTSARDEDVKRFKAADAKTAWDYFLPGRTAVWNGDHDEAIRSYRAALALQPNHYNSLFSLANLFDVDKVNRRPEAIQLFTGCIALRPSYCQPYHNRGDCYAKLGQLDEAIADYREALRLCRGGAEHRKNLHFDLGKALAGKGRQDEAVAHYTACIALGPDGPGGYQNRGGCYFKLGRLDEAITDFRQVLRVRAELAGDHRAELAGDYLNLGHALWHKGRVNEAIAICQKAICLAPNFAMARSYLAWWLATCPDLKVRDPARAVELALRAVELEPKDDGNWFNLGVAHYRAGNWKASIAALEKSVELSNDEPFSYFPLAMAHWKLGHKGEARACYDNAVAWRAKGWHDNADLGPLRAEAEALLGLTDLPRDVFAWP
jgi:serine/threonine protein kinase/tetratricopeptide (TPR) repeat protein